MVTCRTNSTLRAVTIAVAALAAHGGPGEVLDKVAAIVGNEAITLSEVRNEVRIGGLLGLREPSPLEDRGAEVLRRLVDRRLILQDLSLTPFLLAGPYQIEGELRELRGQAFLGGMEFGAALVHYGLSEDDCREFLKERLSFERYVAFRFKTGQDVDPAAVEAYYRDVYAPGQAERGASAEPLEAVSASITQILAEYQANELLAERLQELRLLTRIEMLAFSSGSAP